MTASNELPDVRALAVQFNCNPSTIWRKVANGTFPKPIKFGPGMTRWSGAEIAAMIEAKLAERGKPQAA